MGNLKRFSRPPRERTPPECPSLGRRAALRGLDKHLNGFRTVPPRDCALSLLRVLCCHTPCAVSTAKPVLAWERCRGDLPMDLATVDKLLTTTRTVRKRLDFTRPVAPEIIQTCLEIAIQAPTGGNIPAITSWW